MKKKTVSILILSLLLNLLLSYKARNLIINKVNSYLHANESKDNNIELDKKPYIQPFSQNDNEPLATHSVFNNVDFLTPDSSGIEYHSLPDSLFISRGKYSFYGNNYNLTKGGVYRFIFPEVDNEQRIVFNGNVDTLLSSIAWIFTHGNSDANLNHESLLQKATDSKLVVTCGTVSSLANQILKKFKIRSRVVQGMTLDKWNNYYNGHVLLEVYREKYKKWVLYDLDNNCFLVKNNEPLSFIELSNIIVNNLDYQIVKLSNDTKLAINSFHDKNGFEYDFFSESHNGSENMFKNRYSRLLQVPLINDGYYFYFYNNDSISTKRILTYSNSYKSMNLCEKFIRRFYSDNYNIEKLCLTLCEKN